ncbi:MAG: VTT domain-containing protein, partial [Phycisphaerales bacterium]|nr:VTT domain-containing protein [Phycisphaerales bacterium]
MSDSVPTTTPDPAPPTSGIVRRLGPAGALGVAWAALPALGGFALLWRIGDVSNGLLGLGTATALTIYIVAFAITSGFGVLPTYAQAFLGGWVFVGAVGAPGAVVAALGGFAGGSIIGGVIARLVSQHRVERVIAEHPAAAAARDALIGRGFWRSLWIITLLRLPPNSPFALTNLVLSSSGARWPEYIVGTIVGMTPRTAIVVLFAGVAASDGAQSIGEAVGARPIGLVIGSIITFVVVLV